MDLNFYMCTTHTHTFMCINFFSRKHTSIRKNANRDNFRSIQPWLMNGCSKLKKFFDAYSTTNSQFDPKTKLIQNIDDDERRTEIIHTNKEMKKWKRKEKWSLDVVKSSERESKAEHQTNTLAQCQKEYNIKITTVHNFCSAKSAWACYENSVQGCFLFVLVSQIGLTLSIWFITLASISDNL